MRKRKLTPCSMHNTQKLELWFDKMTSEGLFLENEGYKNTYSIFRESEPQKSFHRIWPKDGINEYSDAKNRRKDFGWELVASSQEYDIFRAYDEKALLIDYDKENNKYVNKSAKKRIIIQILLMLFSIFSFTLIALFAPYIIVSLPMGLFSAILLSFISLLEIIKTIKNIFMILKLKKRNESDIIDENINWKKDTLKYQIPNILYIVILAVFLLIVLYGKGNEPISEALPADKSSVPFATVIDFTNNKESYTPQKSILNKYEKWETHVAKCNYEWTESAIILGNDGKEIKCSLFVDYHETIHPSLARAVAKLYVISSRLSHNAFTSYGKCPSFGFDYEVMFHREFGEPAYIFQDGCKIIHFYFAYYEDIPEDFNNKCIEIIAESIKD